MEGKGKTLRVHCVDERYSNPAVSSFLRENIGPAYTWTCVGASKGFQNERVRSAFFADSTTLIEEAGVQVATIDLVDHFSAEGTHGCKAYGNDDSRERHQANLRQAAEIIRSQPGFEHFAVRLYLHDIDAGTVEPVSVAEAIAV